MDDKRDEKFIFKYIQRYEIDELEDHLRNTAHLYELTEVFDR
jgi:hypothetical protein